jgi:hypothetical protein
MLDQMSHKFQNSTILIGIAIILMQIGGSYITKEIPDYIEEIIDTPILRRFFIFLIVLIYTKDVGTSIFVTLLFVILFTFLLNKRSRYCILTEKMKNKNKNNITKKQVGESLKIMQMYIKNSSINNN